MEYPNSFPQTARDRVEAAKILAIRALGEKWEKASWNSEREALLRDCILDTFLVFAEEVCVLAGGIDSTKRKSEEFLRRLTIEVLYERNYDSRHWISNWGGGLLTGVDQAFRKSPQWKKYEDLLLKQTKMPVTATDALANTEVAAAKATQEAAVIPGPLSPLGEKGRDFLRVRDELKKIKRGYQLQGLSLREMRVRNPDFLVWTFAESLPKEERDTFEHPGTWESGYAVKVFLASHYDRSPATMKKWVSAFLQESRKK